MENVLNAEIRYMDYSKSLVNIETLSPADFRKLVLLKIFRKKISNTVFNKNSIIFTGLVERIRAGVSRT